MGEDTVVCRLKEKRTSLGFTQRQVAEGADINVRTLINIEKGRAIPNLLYAMKIAKFLEMGVEEVFEYSEFVLSNETPRSLAGYRYHPYISHMHFHH